MIPGFLLDEVKVTRVENSAVAGTSELKTDVLDMSGFDGVVFIAVLGDVTDTSVLTLTPKGNTANSDSSPTPVAITGASATYTAAASDADNKLMVVDVLRPGYRYVFASLTRTTANAVVDGIIAVQYKCRSVPVTQGSTVLVSDKSTPEV